MNPRLSFLDHLLDPHPRVTNIEKIHRSRLLSMIFLVLLLLGAVIADRARIPEVFENLIDNALKYTSNQKSIKIEIGVREGTPLTFFVKDNGIGIETQFQSKIFGLFEKLESASEGTGVGLALVKRIIETHGGKIWVESEGAGKGAIFCFTLPTDKGSTQAV